MANRKKSNINQETQKLRGKEYICQNEKGEELIDMCDITRHEVDILKAIRANGQLDHPSGKPVYRERFMKMYLKTERVSPGIILSLPKQCIRQFVKGALMVIGLIKE